MSATYDVEFYAPFQGWTLWNHCDSRETARAGCRILRASGFAVRIIQHTQREVT